MGRKKRSEVQVYSENPFIKQLTIPKKTKTIDIGISQEHLLVSRHTGEVSKESFVGIKTKKEVDSEEFIKLYTSSLGYYMELSSAGQKVFRILLKTMQKTAINKDIVLLTDNVREIFCKTENVQISTTTFNRGKINLIEKNILANSDIGANAYFINPAVVFNGNRFIIVNEYVKKKNKELNKQIEIFNESEENSNE